MINGNEISSGFGINADIAGVLPYRKNNQLKKKDIHQLYIFNNTKLIK